MACDSAAMLDPVACAETFEPPPFPEMSPTTLSTHSFAVSPLSATSCTKEKNVVSRKKNNNKIS